MKMMNESIWFVCTQSTLCQCLFVWVKPCCMMRWHGGGKLSHASPIWEWILQSVFVSWLLGGHPRFIHYLKSCSNSVWDVKHDNTFLYLRGRGSGSWQEGYLNEVLCLFNLLSFLPHPTSASHQSERKRKSDGLTRRVSKKTSSCEINRNCSGWVFQVTPNRKRGYSNKVTEDKKNKKKVTVAEGSPVQWAWLTAQLTTSKGFCWPGTAKRDVAQSLNQHAHLQTCIHKWYSACLWARRFNTCFSCCQKVCVKGAACHIRKILSLALLKRVRQENHTQICTVKMKLQPGDG